MKRVNRNYSCHLSHLKITQYQPNLLLMDFSIYKITGNNQNWQTVNQNVYITILLIVICFLSLVHATKNSYNIDIWVNIAYQYFLVENTIELCNQHFESTKIYKNTRIPLHLLKTVYSPKILIFYCVHSKIYLLTKHK